MTLLYVLSRGVQVEDEVLASHHRVQVQAGDVFLYLLLFDIGCGFSHEFRVKLKGALGFEKGSVDGKMDFVGGGCFVAVEK